MSMSWPPMPAFLMSAFTLRTDACSRPDVVLTSSSRSCSSLSCVDSSLPISRPRLPMRSRPEESSSRSASCFLSSSACWSPAYASGRGGRRRKRGAEEGGEGGSVQGPGAWKGPRTLANSKFRPREVQRGERWELRQRLRAVPRRAPAKSHCATPLP